MELGAFSVSLAVKDLAASIRFYETLGFRAIDGAGGENWRMMRNGACTLGLFQGMFEKNMLTFNPGWVSEERNQDPFTDIRDLQAAFEVAGLTVEGRTDPDGDGPAFITVVDPDGNPVFIDQHRPKPSAP